MLRSFKIFISFSIAFLLLQACGGGGGDGGSNFNGPSYSGQTTQASIDASKSQNLATAAASGAAQSVVADSAGGAFMRPVPSLESKLLEISPKIAEWIVQSEVNYAAKQVNLSEICTAGGSAIENANDAETVGTISFTNCGISDGAGGVLVLTGTVDFTYNTGRDSISMVFHVSATFAGESKSINMTLSCVDFSSASPTCSVSSDFAGLDSRVYRIENINVSGNATSGYWVSSTVYDPDHGYVTMTTSSPIIFNCGNGVPSAGSVTLTGASGTSATISFVSCAEFNVTVEGVSETFYW